MHAKGSIYSSTNQQRMHKPLEAFYDFGEIFLQKSFPNTNIYPQINRMVILNSNGYP
jgi:hypothetical protein